MNTTTSRDDHGRIWFPGNAWPNGHRIAEFAWSAALDPDAGLRFHLHLESADYDEEDDEDDDEEAEDFDDYDADGEWRSKGGWSNYHSCTLSSTAWGNAGLLVGTERAPFDPSTLFSQPFEADPLPVDLEQRDQLAFGLYLTGHDAAAAHRVAFRRSSEPNCVEIDWTGNIAMTYIGSTEFRFTFRAKIGPTRFKGIVMPDGVEPRQCEELLAKCVTSPAALRAL
jgi:hypothetical protein